MRRFAAAASLALALALAASPAPADLRDPPDACRGTISSGPTSVSCPFLYSGGRVLISGVVAQAGVTPTGPYLPGPPVQVTVDITRESGPSAEPILSCSFSSGSVPIPRTSRSFVPPVAACVDGAPALPVEPGTTLRCRARGSGRGVFACATFF